MKYIKYLTVILLIDGLTLFLTGCWNYREVDTLAIVAGIAVDQGEQGYKYHLTFELLDFSSGGAKEGSVKPKLLESDGDTIFDAVRNAIRKSGNKLFFSHSKVFIISHDLAQKGIYPILDWINRDSELRKMQDIIVSKESTAKQILYQKAMTGRIVSYEIDKSLENDALHLAKTPIVRLYQANNMLNGSGISLILPAIKVDASQSEKTPEFDGIAVFKGDKLVGYLNSDDTKCFLFIVDKVKGGLWLTNVGSNEKNISLEIFDSNTKVTPVVTDGKLTINLLIQTKVSLGEMESTTDYESQSGIRSIEAKANSELERKIENLVSKVQKQFDSDIFGFGETVYQDDPQYWSEKKSGWNSTFQHLPVKVSAAIEIQNTATVKNSMKPGG